MPQHVSHGRWHHGHGRGIAPGRADLEMIMRLTRTRAAVLVPLASVALLLGACSGDEPTDDESTTEEATDDTTEEAEETDKPTGGDEDDDAGASEGAACLVGQWSGDTAEQVAAMEEIMASSGLEATINLSGEVVSEFTADGQATSTYNSQVMDIAFVIEGQELKTTTTMNGTTTGTYTATDTEVTMTVTDASGLLYSTQTSVGGVPMDMGDAAATDQAVLDAMETTSTVTYTCSGDVLTMTTPNVGLGADIESVLHRR
jgi:hypothetical protein